MLALAASFGIQAWIAGGVLAFIVVLNIVIGFFQTLQAENSINSLRTLGLPTCNVYRGDTINIPTAEVVPGDIIDLNTGDSVPADIRLIEAVNLEADEALLTGESAPIVKSPALTFDADTGPGDRLNVVYSSTTITKGRGRGVVFATGMHTEIGAIAGALNSDGKKMQDGTGTGTGTVLGRAFRATKDGVGEFLGLTVGTPLQRKLSQLFICLFAFAVVCALVVLGANKFRTSQDVVLYAVTTAVGTIPVSLLLVLTVTMAAGTKKMIERHVIVRNLSSLEALGGVTNICSDKTGTITQGRMVVRKAWVYGHGTYSVETGNQVFSPTEGTVSFQPHGRHEAQRVDSTADVDAAVQSYLNVASLANLATLENTSGDWKARGAPTEIAIEVFARRFGWDRARLSQGEKPLWQHVAEYPFDSDVKKMSVVFRNATTGRTHVFAKGAVERVLEICTATPSHPLTESARSEILSTMDALAAQGLRVLALAEKQTTVTAPREGVEKDLTFRGLIGIYDPPRPESLHSVQMCQAAGITVHMLTGDHPATAQAIAREVSILPDDKQQQHLAQDTSRTVMMTATQFDSLSDDEIDALPSLPLVVARCAPSTKVRMIEALHRRGRYVAMTGDGVNDSPSLKRADIGIAMGTGSDVAKEASDIVLTDDNFASILNAIEEGRRIFDNIQKFILHVLAANIGFVVALLTGLAFKDGSGVSVFLLAPVEILWMLMATGAFCETGLGFERAVPDILRRPPQNLSYGVFTPEFLLDMVLYGLLMACCTIGSFVVVIYGFNDGNLGMQCNNRYSESCEAVFRARATSYTTMTWIFLLFAWELIDFRRSLFDMPRGVKAWAAHFWSNKFLFFAVTIVFAAVFPTLYIPVVNDVIFMHRPISWEWAVVFVAVGVYLAGNEGWKWAKRVYLRRTGQHSKPRDLEAL